MARQRVPHPPLATRRLRLRLDNAPSCGLVEKLGFRCEGLLRDNLRVGDEWRDDTLYALLATERRSLA